MNKPSIYTDEKPFACLDTDGYLNIQGQRCWWWHIDDPKRIRRARFQQWQDKHSILVVLSLLASIPIGIWLFCFVMAHLEPKPEPEPVLSQQGQVVEKEFSELSEDDQNIIGQKWQEQQPSEDQPDPPDYP